MFWKSRQPVLKDDHTDSLVNVGTFEEDLSHRDKQLN